MDSITIRHLRESVALLPMENYGPADEFYRRLFGLAPEVRPMFNREIGLQAKKFSDMLAWVITNLDRPDELLREMLALGARHSGYGVTIDQYAPVGSALIWMFQHTLGDRFTPEMEEAWLEFYAFLSFEMERALGKRRRRVPISSPHPSTDIDLSRRSSIPSMESWRSTPFQCWLNQSQQLLRRHDNHRFQRETGFNPLPPLRPPLLLSDKSGGTTGLEPRPAAGQAAFEPTQLRPRKLIQTDFPVLPRPCGVVHCFPRP